MTAALSYAVWAVLGTGGARAVGASRTASGSPLASSVRGRLRRLATGPVLRVLLVLGWMWVGWHLFAR